MDVRKNTELIQRKALELGFSHCTFAAAGHLSEEEQGFEAWLRAGYHADMDWLERNLDKRLDPRKLEPWAKSVIVLALNYFPTEVSENLSDIRISKYAWGRDYHKVIRKRMQKLIEYMGEEIGQVSARGFVDSGPVAERAWARRSGMGWIGKNSLTLIKRAGSFYFLAVIITDLELEYNEPATLNYCGSCTLCIEACPTAAIIKPGVVDARRCISYLTIELEGEFPPEFSNKTGNWAFGCDVCQDVCPHNKRYSIASGLPDFSPNPLLFQKKHNDWLSINEEDFKSIFNGTPVKRTGFDGFIRNIRNIPKQQ